LGVVWLGVAFTGADVGDDEEVAAGAGEVLGGAVGGATGVLAGGEMGEAPGAGRGGAVVG